METMAKQALSFRFEENLIGKLKTVSEEKGTSLNGLVEQTLENIFLKKNVFQVKEAAIGRMGELYTNGSIGKYLYTNGEEFLFFDELELAPEDIDGFYLFETIVGDNYFYDVKLIG